MGIDALTKKLTYGLHVISVTDAPNGGRFAGFVIDAVCQISAGEEPVVLFSVMNKNYSKDCIAREGVFNVSVLPDDVDPFILANFGYQSSKDVSKWDNVVYELKSGLPVIPQAVTWAQLKVKDVRVFDTHTAFFCVPIEAEYLNAEKDPVRYADYFTKLKEPAFAAFQAFKAGQAGKETG
jgi:flavin reductase (DIM6/NTAB) family NADH-FMN oxidoreductase RutF